MPIWYEDLGFNSPLQAAVLIAYQHAWMNKKKINVHSLSSMYREVAEHLQERLKLFNDELTNLRSPVDFDLHYDVPVDFREEVQSHVIEIAKQARLPRPDFKELSYHTIRLLEERLRASGEERRHLQLEEILRMPLPRREWFKSPFEWQVCVKLWWLKLKAEPYRGEFEGLTDNPMATDNPDMVIKDGLTAMIECKGKGEWGEVITYDKKKWSEMYGYQAYVEDVKANSIVFIAEGKKFGEPFLQSFKKESAKLRNVILVTWGALQAMQESQDLLNKFRKALQEPESLEATQRIL